jgi:hypothetical protein
METFCWPGPSFENWNFAKPKSAPNISLFATISGPSWMLCTVGYTRHPQALLVVPVLPEESVRLLTNGNLRKRLPKRLQLRKRPAFNLTKCVMLVLHVHTCACLQTLPTQQPSEIQWDFHDIDWLWIHRAGYCH